MVGQPVAQVGEEGIPAYRSEPGTKVLLGFDEMEVQVVEAEQAPRRDPQQVGQLGLVGLGEAVYEALAGDRKDRILPTLNVGAQDAAAIVVVLQFLDPQLIG